MASSNERRLESWKINFIKSFDRQREQLVDELGKLAVEFDDDIAVELENIDFQLDQLYVQVEGLLTGNFWDEEKFNAIQKLRGDTFVQLDNIELRNREDLNARRLKLYGRLSALTQKLIEVRQKFEDQSIPSENQNLLESSTN